MKYTYKIFNIRCTACRMTIGVCSVSAIRSRFKFYCDRECLQLKRHLLKIKENKKFHNLVDTSTYALKNLLGLPAKEIPADFRVAMFHVFKTRKLISKQAEG